jgi:hypothetical protein
MQSNQPYYLILLLTVKVKQLHVFCRRLHFFFSKQKNKYASFFYVFIDTKIKKIDAFI